MTKEETGLLMTEIKKSVDEMLETGVKEIAGREVAEATRKIVEEMRAERLIFGYDRSGLDTKQKESLAKAVKAIAGVATKSNEEMVSEVDSRGGYLLPTEVANAIERIARSVGVVLSQVTRWPMASDKLAIPAYTGSALTGEYLGVNAAGSLTAITFKQAMLVAHKWQLAFALGNDLLELSGVDLADWLMALAGESLANMIDYQAFKGGSASGDPFVGLLNDANVDAYTMTLSSGKDTFAEYAVIDDSSTAIGSVEEALLPGAAFYFSRTVWASLRTQKDDTGNYLLGLGGMGASLMQNLLKSDPKSPAGPRPVGEILGFPVYTCRHLPALSATAVSTKFGLFGDMSKMAYGQAGDMRLERYNSGTFGGKEIALADQTGFVFKQRHALATMLPEAFVPIKTAAS